MFVPNFKILGEVVPEKSLTKIEKESNNKFQPLVLFSVLHLVVLIKRIFVREKVKWTNKGTIGQYVADS